MICVICRQAEIIDRLTSVTLERGELRIVVNSVPARICPGCGEAYVDEDVAVRLLREGEEISRSGTLNVVREF